MLSIRKFESSSALAQLEPVWRSLEAASSVPFATWDWASVWWSLLREKRVSTTDSLWIRTVHDASGETIAIAPLMLTRRPSLGPVCVRQLQFMGADPNVTELRGLVAVPGREREAYRALLEHLTNCADEWDTALLSGLDDETLEFARGALPGTHFLRQVPCYQLELAPSWAEFKTSLPRNIKESLRKCYNSLKRDGLSASLEVLTRVDEVDAGLDDFFRLHAERSLATGTIEHPNAFRALVTQSFLREVCAHFAARDKLRIFRLRVGDRVVAVRIGFAMGDCLYFYYSGYDLAFAQYSVMTTTLTEALKYAIEEGFTRAHLATGTDVSKTRWRPLETHVNEVSVASPSARGQAVHRLFHGLKNAAHAPLFALPMRLLGRRSAWTPKAHLVD
jgi:CelD/BcsL family acetyltransferase involved in cellulose biosynthesis